MPIYEFKCEPCNHVKEEIVKMGTTEIPCDKCGQAMQKTMGSFKCAVHGLPNGHIAVRATK